MSDWMRREAERIRQLLWLVSLVIVSALRAALAVAQTRLPEPRVLSGNDIGFRVEGRDVSGNPTGTFVVRINDEWREVGFWPYLRTLK